MFDLLTAPVIPVTPASGSAPVSLSLPHLYAELAADRVDEFPWLAAHQRQAFYQFLVQVGAMALHRAGCSDLPSDEGRWRDMLTGLAPDHAGTAWSLVVEDFSAPAFMQPPTSRIDEFRKEVRTPDALDILVTAKNHDRKREVAVHGAPHLWMGALLTLQTAQGFSGFHNYGIARMNGGMSSRVLVDRRPNSRWGRRIERALRMLLARRQEVLRSVPEDLFQPAGGLALTWLAPWDDDISLDPADLDPWFVEVCRRVRLTIGSGGEIAARTRTSRSQRIEAKLLKGRLGDPWTPLDRRKSPPVALTVSATGFDYRLVQQILFMSEKFTPPLSLKYLSGEKKKYSELHLAVLVRGQGETEGLHERVIPLPASVAEHLPQDDEDDEPRDLANLSQKMVSLAGAVRKTLRWSLLVHMQGGPEKPDSRKKDANTSVAAYDRTVDDRFFDHLFRAPKIGFDESHAQWQKVLREEAVRVARAAWSRNPAPRARREKARAAAESALCSGLRKHLPDAFAKPQSEENAA